MKTIVYIAMLLVSFVSLASPSPLTKVDECLLAGRAVHLEGKIGSETFPGRPNYDSIKDGDEPETYWIFTSDQSFCGLGYHYATKKLYRIEGRSKRFQLLLKKGCCNNVKNLLDKKVILKGQMFVGNNGHHHTKMLIEVTNIEPAL